MENNKALYIANDDWLLDSPEGNILFLFTNFLYLFTVLAFSIGGPWRKPFFTNIPFMVVFVFIITYSIVIVMVPAARLGGFQIIFPQDQGFSQIRYASKHRRALVSFGQLLGREWRL